MYVVYNVSLVITIIDYSLVVLQLKREINKNYSVERSKAVENDPDSHTGPVTPGQFRTGLFCHNFINFSFKIINKCIIS